MEIWEEPYESEKYGKETESAFLIFDRMLGEPARNLKVMAKKLVYEDIEAEKDEFLIDHSIDEYKPPSEKQINKRISSKYSTLSQYSSSYEWKKRFAAYDLYISLKHREQKEKMVLEWEKQQLEIALSRPFIHHETLEQIHNSSEEDMPISKRAYSEETNERAYYNSLQAVYSILHSGVQVVESSETQQLNIKKEEKIISNTIFDAVDKVLGLKSDEKVTKKSKTIKKEPKKVIKNE